MQIPEIIKTLAAALGPMWLRVAGLVAALLGAAFSTFRAWLVDNGYMLADLPNWAFWVIGLLAYIAFALLNYSNKLRLSLKPTFDVTIHKQPDRVRVGLGEKMSIRGHVTARTGRHNYTATILSVEKFAGTSFVQVPIRSAINLYWPDTKKGTMVIAENVISLAPGEHQTFDILESHSTGGLRVPGDAQMPTWIQQIFSAPGKYKVEVSVSSGDTSVSKELEVDWTGEWDKLSFQEENVSR